MGSAIFLVRHAAHADVGQRLTGRGSPLGLTDAGRRQALALAERLATEAPAAVHCSPQRRAQETAAAIAGRSGAAITTVAALDEIDFGGWTGRSFAELEGDAGWQQWNCRRSAERPPGGESMAEAQQRAVAHLLASGASPGSSQPLVMVSHADIIRAIFAYALGLSLDRLLDFACDPASISRVAVDGGAIRLLAVNDSGQ